MSSGLCGLLFDPCIPDKRCEGLRKSRWGEEGRSQRGVYAKQNVSLVDGICREQRVFATLVS